MKPEPRADALYLRHMLECIERIEEYVARDETRFKGSRLIQDAVVRNLQTLAESSQRLSETIQASEPGIAWRAIAGFRNILVHDYLGIDSAVIWGLSLTNCHRFALHCNACNTTSRPHLCRRSRLHE